jgi:hypothetical protein
VRQVDGPGAALAYLVDDDVFTDFLGHVIRALYFTNLAGHVVSQLSHKPSVQSQRQCGIHGG